VKCPGTRRFALARPWAKGFAHRMDFPPPLPPKAKSNDPIIIGASVVLAIIVVCGAGIGGTMIARRAQARREALKGFEKSVAEERTKMADSIRSGKMDDGDAAIGRVKDQLGKSAAQLGGADALAARAMGAWLEKVQVQMRDYQTSAARLREGKIFTFDIRDHAAIEPTRQMVRDFLASNAGLTDTLQHGEKQVRAELDAVGVPATTRDATLAGYSKAHAAQLPVQMQIRSCDKTLGESALAILDLLDQNWGRWQRDEASGHLRFQDDATRLAYNASIQKIQSASAEQKKAQEQLAAQLKAAPAP
jgi:hypothetical protein